MNSANRVKKKYEYKRPEGKLYKVSARKWNKYYGMGVSRAAFVEVYVAEGKAVTQVMPAKWFLALTVMGLPFIYLVGTIREGFSEAHDTTKSVLFMKESGSFRRDEIDLTDFTENMKLREVLGFTL